MPRNSDDELREIICQTFSDELKELLTNNWDKIREFVRQSESKSTNMSANLNLDMSKANAKTKTRLTFSQIVKDSLEDEIGDPAQPEFDETTKIVPKKRGKTAKAAAPAETDE